MRARDLFVVAAPGLEAVVAGEITSLLPGLELRSDPAGISLRGGDLELCRLNLGLRAASRVLARIAQVRASSFSELHRRAARLPWEDYLRPGAPVVIRATAKRSRLYHTGGIAERIVKGIHERLGAEPKLLAEADAGPDAQRIIARLLRDRLTLSVDASGELLHRRGYRRATAKAPLRENLAAGVLLATLEEGDALLDPMCGAGTLGIEGALLMSGAAPGRRRRFACERWPSFDAAAMIGAREGLAEPVAPSAPIVSSDRNSGAVAATSANAERAGVAPWMTIAQGDLADVQAPAPRGLVVLNPPYGVRISQRRSLPGLYAQIGATLREQLGGPALRWRLALLAPDPALAEATGLELERRLELRNGGIAVDLWTGPIG